MTKERSNVLEFIKNHSWEIKENALYKKYIFSSFSLAIKFINQVAEVSKANSHHPKLINSYNSVEVFWITNDVGYITETDVELAKKCDYLNEMNFLKNEI
tara:strand:- start:1930 stop:2229 length:300 start_codon:yes stop_codon:yes gene_type:complete